MGQIRLLICHQCHSIDPIPWCGEDPNCKHPECIAPLEFRMAQHRDGTGIPHAPANLATVDEELWADANFRAEALRQIENIANPGQAKGLGQSLYDVRDTFQADAMTCWKRHNRTTDCGDYKHDRMRLVPDTKAERKDLGLDTSSAARPSHFLCDYCPMKSIKQQRVYSEQYKYDYNG